MPPVNFVFLIYFVELFKTKFFSLQEFSPSALNKLKFVDLIRKSRFSDECLNESRKVFKTNYSSKEFHVTETGHEYDINDRVIFNANVINDFLYAFGDLIEKLEIDFYEINESLGHQMVKIVDYKCSATVKSLELTNCTGNVLDGLKTNFTEVKTFKVSFGSLAVDKDWKLSFFPNVNELDF